MLSIQGEEETSPLQKAGAGDLSLSSIILPTQERVLYGAIQDTKICSSLGKPGEKGTFLFNDGKTERLSDSSTQLGFGVVVTGILPRAFHAVCFLPAHPSS